MLDPKKFKEDKGKRKRSTLIFISQEKRERERVSVYLFIRTHQTVIEKETANTRNINNHFSLISSSSAANQKITITEKN